ncbi:MAG: M48 family metalloprotease [Hyphomicrobiales bacterium]
MLGYQFSIGSPLAVITLALTLSAFTLGGRSLHRFRKVSVQSWAESGLSPRLDRYGPFEVVVFEDTRLRALSVPGRAGRRGQVHLTTGLLGALLPEQLDVVCAHEEAHLRLAHHRYLGVATTVEGAMWFWPPSKSSARVLRRALERSADECAAGDSVRVRAQLASALLTVAVEIDRPVLAAFSALDGLVERVAAMHEPTAKGNATWWWPFIIVPGIVLAVVSFYALTRVGRGAYCWVTMPGGCHLR